MSAALAQFDDWEEEPKSAPFRPRIYLAASRHDEVSTVTNLGGTTGYAYDRSSLKTKVSYPNATTAANTYDRARRILTLVNRQGAAPVSSYSYTYDSNGNRTQQIETNGGTAETTSYAFDNNDRLTTVNYPDKQTVYTFDANANRVSEITTAGGATTQSKTYTYNPRNQLTAVADSLNPANDAQYTFDANGNQTTKTQGANTTSYTYDVKDQLIAVNQNNANLGVFAYDYQGHRIVKDMGGSIVRYAYDGNSVLVETDTSGSTIAKFDYGPDRLLSMNHATEGRAYYLFDALGSVANLTNTAGGIQARYQYDAFGNYRSTAGASFNRFAFTGHEKDNETNLYYFGARYYDPWTSVWQSADPILGKYLDGKHNGGVFNSTHLALYSYVGNNPVLLIDPNGLAEILFANKADESVITDHSKKVISDKADAAKISSVTVSSIERSAEQQRNSMYKTIEADGVAAAKDVYGNAGDKVVDASATAKTAKKSVDEIKKAMLDQLNLEPTSRHMNQDKSKKQIIDIAPSSIPTGKADEWKKQIQSGGQIADVILPGPGERAYHLEINQPPPPPPPAQPQP